MQKFFGKWHEWYDSLGGTSWRDGGASVTLNEDMTYTGDRYEVNDRDDSGT